MFVAKAAPKKGKEENALMKPVSPKKVNIPVEPRTLEEDIRMRAYELFEARGREEGHELDDWLRAEAEKTGRTTRNVAA